MYEKQNFYAGQKLMASHLEAMEEGIIEALNKEIVSSWNDLTDRPFYEKTEVVTEEMTVEWDGVVGDRYTFDLSEAGLPGVAMVHVSDAVIPSVDSVIGAVLVSTAADGSTKEEVLTEVNATDADGLISINAISVMSVPQDDFVATEGMIAGSVISKKGLYFVGVSGMTTPTKYTGILSGAATTIKKIDEKFIPDTIARVSDVEAVTILTSPNGTKYRLTVSDDGTLSATAIVAE